MDSSAIAGDQETFARVFSDALLCHLSVPASPFLIQEAAFVQISDISEARVMLKLVHCFQRSSRVIFSQRV